MSASLYKPGYDGPQPAGRLNPGEVAPFNEAAAALERRLLDAMLVLSSWDDHTMGGGSGWPQYVHEFSDLIGWDPADQPAPRERFDPTPAQESDALKALALLDGVRKLNQRVLFLRAIGRHYGGWSFDTIGETFERSGEWARRTYEAVLIQAARRCGILDPEPRGHAIVVASVSFGGWRTYIAQAADPSAELATLRAKSPVGMDEAFAFWVAGKPVAERIIKGLRKSLLNHKTHGSWHLVSPDSMEDQLVTAARAMGAAWSIEQKAVLRLADSGPRTLMLRPERPELPAEEAADGAA